MKSDNLPLVMSKIREIERKQTSDMYIYTYYVQ